MGIWTTLVSIKLQISKANLRTRTDGTKTASRMLQLRTGLVVVFHIKNYKLTHTNTHTHTQSIYT